MLLQHCTVLMGTEGLSVRWEIDSKTLQSSIFLRPEVSFYPIRHATWLSLCGTGVCRLVCSAFKTVHVHVHVHVHVDVHVHVHARMYVICMP